MFVRVVSLLVTFGVLVAGKSFKAHIADLEANVPQDNERGAKIVANLVEKANANQKAYVAASKAARAMATQNHVNTKRSPSKVDMATTMAGPNDGLNFHGYFVNRTRAHADCSGPVSVVEGIRMSCAEIEDGYYLGNVCFRDTASGSISYGVFTFDNPSCAGQPYEALKQETYPACGLDFKTYHENGGFQMVGAQCTTNVELPEFNAPGMTMSYHDDDQCESPPAYFYSIPFGGCMLMREDDGSGFAYYRLTGCLSDGEVEAVVYSDAACIRPRYRARHNFYGTNTASLCVPGGGGATRFLCSNGL